ncbi:MAG: alkaline phosphatase family protein [Anaerolineales bacterium]|nr:alkaline phosphatase family protein [Anaerolineales bacterium]
MIVNYKGNLRVLVILVALVSLFLPGERSLAQDLGFSQVTTDASRPHQVQASTPTSYVLELVNPSPEPMEVSLAITASTAWTAELFFADELFRPTSTGFPQATVELAAQESRYLVAYLTAPAGLSEGEVGAAHVTANGQTVDLKAAVRNVPKVFFVSMDGCGGGYLYIDRNGQWDTGTYEPLMPRTRDFLEQSAFFPNAFGLLPSITDPNHMSVVSGSWPGTLGVANVFHHFAGIDPTGEPVFLAPSKDLLRWGDDGASIQTVYDVLPAGNPDVYNAFLSGKELTGHLLDDGNDTMDTIAGGIWHPYYLQDPQLRKIGDPPSDPDAATDRDGTNLFPSSQAKMYQSAGLRDLNAHPSKYPSDRWVMDSALRILFAEDPDLFYINMGDCDDGEHYLGAADRPPEWTDLGTPEVLWDDANLYNPRVNRGAVLDIVFEADYLFGRFLDALDLKQTADQSVVSLLSDHGQVTLMDDSLIDMGDVLTDLGISQDDVEMITASGSIGYLYLTDSSLAAAVASQLADYTLVHPLNQATVHPFVVLDRDEMDSGIDDVYGPLVEDGVAGNRRGELYSAWNIDHPVHDTSKVRWPDLWVFTLFRFNIIHQSSPEIGGALGTFHFTASHGSPESSWVQLAMRGPGLAVGVHQERVSLADVAPTLYALLGFSEPANVDGEAILSALR